MPSVMEMVTDRIIQKLEQGTIPWRLPWIMPDRGAYNIITGRKYSHLNNLILNFEGPYASYKQWNSLNGTIHEDAIPEMVVFWKWPDPEPDEETEDEPTEGEHQEKGKRRIPILRYHRVYHISQVKGVSAVKTKETNGYDHHPIKEAEKLFRAYVKKENIIFDEGEYAEAYYSPNKDLIHVPSIRLYKDPEAYYSTIFHEMVHSSGAPKRLNREGLRKVNFGSEVYSKEELIAEMGAAMLMASVGIETDKSFENSTAYINGWLSALKGDKDKKMVVFAASQSEKAYNYILGN